MIEEKIPSIETIITRIKGQELSKYHIKSLALFGSYVQKKATEESDIDILVDFERPIGLEIVDLKDELESVLGIPVDLIPRNGLKRNKKLFEYIQDQLVYVTP